MSALAGAPPCPLCGREATPDALSEAGWIAPEVEERLVRAHPEWRRRDGACPACLQWALLETLRAKGDAALLASVQHHWPLDPEAAFGALPTPLRLRADPRFCGRKTTIALVDAAFYPHPDLVRPENRIRAWVDATCDTPSICSFSPDDVPVWSSEGA
ncbi:MAG TPA: hypothetical protein VLI67_00975, partial [Vicinamibacteria bacterium]|nr:hypothetical protein [Vicinamibacteria bacterium]